MAPGAEREIMKRVLPVFIIISFACGLIAQFIWKMIYFPEPIVLVIFELGFIIILAIGGCYCSLKR